jgi:prophage tail gpP-like protein
MAADPDAVAVIIDGTSGLFGGGTTFAFWSEIEFKFSIDTYGTIALTAPFERDRKEFREAFRPFSFKSMSATIGGVLVFTGTMVGIEPKVEPNSSSVAVTGYSKPGVLNDCTPDVASYPLEFNKLYLSDIASKLCKPFEINISMPAGGAEGSKFDRVACEPDQKIQDFLAELAKQRGLVMSSNADGDLVFQKSVSEGSPVAKLEGQPVISVTPTFSPQEYYSKITGIASAKSGKKGSRYTTQNAWLASADVMRPLTFKAEDTDKGDAPSVTLAKLGRMFGAMVSYVVDLPTWRDPSDRLWVPNKTVKLKAPEAMIYSETEFLIRDVTLKQSADSKTTSLNLVLPGAFSGELPESLPWEE